MKAIPKRTLLVTCIVILLPMFFGLALWNRLPERMPTHFDFSGTADDYSGRPFAVIGLPLSCGSAPPSACSPACPYT